MRPARSTAALAALVCFFTPAAAKASRVLVMDRAGHVRAVDEPAITGADDLPGVAAGHDRAEPARPGVRAAAASKIPGALRELYDNGSIDLDVYDQAKGSYSSALKLLHKVSGFRKLQMGGVIGDLEAMAAAGRVTADRLPALMETLDRNVEWWSKGPLLSPGARVSFTDSQIVWQHYANHGIQIQWLGTFGKANALFNSKSHDTQFQEILDQSLGLAGNRAGGVAFEYLFPFDGGRPPWVSGLAQATALTALSRGAIRLQDSSYFDAARSALGIFKTPPPTGVAQKLSAGTHYLQYSFAPTLHVLNGFVQSLNGLHDFAKLANDDEGRTLFADGEAELRAELPSYDTGGWSRYSQGRDSDLSYHKLLAGFLHGLCTRMDADGENGALYCDASDRFDADLTTPATITVAEQKKTLHRKHLAYLGFTIDKPALVTLVISQKQYKWYYRVALNVGSGAHSFAWRPRHSGSYAFTLRAVDLAGNAAKVDGTETVRK